MPSPEWLAYVDPYRSLDQRADLFRDVSARLPDHQARFAAAARGTLNDAHGQPYASEHGLGAWVGGELAIAAAYQGFVHGSYRHDGWGPEPVPRAIQIQRIVDPGTGRSGLFAHFHGIRDPEGKHDTPERAVQAKAVVDAIGRMRQPDEPVILAGDFNLLPDSSTFAAFSAIGLVDLVTTGGFTDTRTSLYAKSQRYADYLLVSEQVKVEAFDVPATPEVSDHRPLVLDFRF